MEKITMRFGNDFSCYTTTANRSMKGHAETFLNKVNKANESSYGSVFEKKFIKAMEAYIRSYMRFRNTKTGDEGGAGDSEVRGIVHSICCSIARKANISETVVENTWDKTYSW